MDFKEVSILFGWSVLFVVGLIVTITGTVAIIDARACYHYGQITKLETTHIGVDICMVNDPDYGWISYAERNRQRNAERLNLKD